MNLKWIRCVHNRRLFWISIVAVFMFFQIYNAAWMGSIKLSLKCISLNTASADEDIKTIESSVNWPHETSDLLPDPDVTFGKLSNGVRYVLMENNEPENRVSMHLNVQAGSLNEFDNEQGLAHFLEHILFCGSTNFQPGDLVKYFQRIGMKFGPDANAYTSFLETVYDILLPDGSEKSIEEGLVVLNDFAQGALLLESEINRERGVILSEKNVRDSVSYRTYLATLEFEFPESKISKRPPIGKEEVIKNADQKLFKDFYYSSYRPENLILVLVGNFKTQTAVSLIEKTFSKLTPKGGRRPSIDMGRVDHKGIKPFYHYEKEAGSTSSGIEVISMITQKNDSLDFQKQKLFKDIADQIVQYRLDAMVSKPETPFTAAHISSDFFLKQIQYADITAESSPEKWDQSMVIIEQTLRKALEYGFLESELDRAKKEAIANLDNQIKKAPTRSSKMLAQMLISSINNNQVFQSPVQGKNIFENIIHSLTLKDVHDAFKNTWAPDHRLLIVTGNATLSSNKTDAEKTILSVFNKSRKVKVQKPVEKKVPVFPYLNEPVGKGVVTSKTDFSKLGIQQYKFKNGVFLNLKKTDFKADQVLVKLSFGPGKADEPPDLEGISLLGEEVINGSGLGGLDSDELVQALAGKEINVFFTVEEDAFSFQGNAVSKEVTLLLQLLYAHIVDPGYREDAYILSMEQFSQKYQMLSHSIDGAMTLQGTRFLAGGDQRFGFPSYEVLKRLELKHVKSWIDPYIKKDRIEISVVGDFDVEEVISVVSKYFGTLPQRDIVRSSQITSLPSFPTENLSDMYVETKIPKALVVVAYPTEDMWNVHRTRRLNVLADIFSDRLRERIRETLGASYSPFAYNRPSRAYPGYGVFSSFIHVSPEEAIIVEAEVKKISSDMQQHGVTGEELQRAIKPSITSIKDIVRSNSYWLNTVLSGSSKYPEQIDWSRTLMTDYASITADELSEIAKQYLDNNKAAVVMIRPKANKPLENESGN
jgi:zinc protease